ncbi:GNAT family N-acetyltransferase [Cellulosimicrobium composti]|uniref:GNAT family N-acetyltransferase n=1 Tax=Cellulosimicrobium composti TaxID=2672572 RepID=A0A6N7ZLH8_9MICO|nr:GNAT family N-acetyltransferase [Cellulosimicrobium composti]MTG90351.1 GNAT family N-acetyltransferase [Cellulosimicrobium composti]NDO90612.1 GNAT family N-acetyltransferase [Cellulosimicrobium composti]HEV6954738.1 GNAT family N-acetyltransferase [Promicromonospora sp.]
MTRTQTLHVAATTYTSRTLAVRGIPGDDVAAWSALAHRAAEPNVFFEPEFLLPTVSSFDPDGGVRLLVVERAGEWVAVMPYEMVPGDRHWPRRHASNDGPVLNQVTSLGSPLLAAADPDAAAATLVAALRAHARELGRAFAFAYVADDGAAGGALRRALEGARVTLHVWGGDDRAAVRFAELSDDEDPLAHVPRSRAKAVRRRVRRLGDELGQPVALSASALVPVTDPAEFLAFEHETWKADPERNGPGFSRVEGGEAWFSEVFSAYAAMGNASIVALVAAGVTLYMAGFLRSGSHVFAWYDEYADRFARFAPGVVGRLLTIRLFAADPSVTFLDSCMHPSLYPDQNELYPSRLRTASYTAALGPRPVGWVLRAVPVLGRLRRRLARRAAPAPAAAAATGSAATGSAAAAD